MQYYCLEVYMDANLTQDACVKMISNELKNTDIKVLAVKYIDVRTLYSRIIDNNNKVHHLIAVLNGDGGLLNSVVNEIKSNRAIVTILPLKFPTEALVMEHINDISNFKYAENWKNFTADAE